jgi:hypothetical protein
MNVFARYEQKYRLDLRMLTEFSHQVSAHLREDEHSPTQISSLYLDTPDQLLVSRSMEKPTYKEKLRLRVYGSQSADTDQTVFLEMKKKLAGKVYKRRAHIDLAAAQRLIEHGIEPEFAPDSDRQQRQITRELAYSLAHYENLEPYLWVSCLRHSWVEQTASVANLRITCDTQLCWQTGCWQPNLAAWQPLLAANWAIVEIKCCGALPLWLTRILKDLRMYPQSFSKIATAHTLHCGIERSRLGLACCDATNQADLTLTNLQNNKEDERTWTSSSIHSWPAPRALQPSRQWSSSSAPQLPWPWEWSAPASICTGIPTTKGS